MLNPVKWNLWDYVVDSSCLRTDCGEEKYIIVWDWRHRVPMPFSAVWWYTAWDGIKISDDWVISVDPSSIDMSDYYKKDQVDNLINNLNTQITNLNNKITQMEQDDPELVKFITVTMDWDTETTASDDFITNDTDVTPTWTSWSPNWIIETYVETWKVTIRSSENENWTVRLRLSKPKS